MVFRKNSQFRELRQNYPGFYYAWCAMKRRCLAKTGNDYPRYGGRGITVSNAWLDFANFYRDMYKSWVKHKKTNTSTSLERIDVNGHYCKENCRWATMKEQSNNRRRHKLLTYKGVTLNLVQWAEKLGIKKSTLSQRIYVYKWTVDKALTT